MSENTPLHEQTAAAGARFTEEAGWSVPVNYGDPAAEYRAVRESAGLFDLSHHGKVEVTGPDAASFLHNLSTNQVNEMPVGAGCEAFLATAKAKAVAFVHVYHALLYDGRPAFWLDTPPGLGEKVIQHLDHYLVSEQLEMADRTREFAQVHLAGPQAKTVLEKALVDDVPPLEEHQHMVRTFGINATCHVRRVSRLGVPGYDVLSLGGRAAVVWQLLLRAGAKPAGTEAFEVLRVEAGMPAQSVEIDDATFIPEVGRSAQAISYNKGCYIGQEPVVMARDRGHINRLLLGVKLPAGVVPRGTLLYRDGKEVGRVTSSVQSPTVGSAIGLAYLRRGNWEAGTKVEADAHGTRQPAEVVTLPFA